MTSGELREETLAAVDRIGGPGEPVTASELATEMECTRRTAYDRLERLADGGERSRGDRDPRRRAERTDGGDLKTKKVGARGRVWWRPQKPDPSESISAVLDKSDVGVFVLDEEFDVAWVNEATERYFGIDRDDVVGRDKRALIDETIASKVEEPTAFTDTVFATYDDNTYAERFECRVRAGENRETRWLEHRSKPIETGRYAGGRVELYYDVTRRRETERVLDESEQQFQSLIDATDEYAIFRLDADGRVETWNAGAETLTGYDPDEILGERVSTFYTDDDVADDVPERNLARAAAEGVFRDDGWRVRKDGSRYWAHVTINPIYDEDGDVAGYAKVTRDMTDRRRYEQRLRQQRDYLEHELDEVFERIDDAFYALDDELRFTYVNEQAEALLERSAEELLDERLHDVFPGTDLEETYRRTLRSQNPSSFETYTDRLGAWIEVNVYPSESGLSVYFRDVTERKEREQELELYETIVETVGDGVYAVDRDARFVLVNDAFCEMTGWNREELLGRRATTVHDEEIAPRAGRLAAEVDRGERETATVELEIDPKDGERFPAESRVSPFAYDGRGGRCGVVRDVTEREARRRELERQRAQLEALNELNAVVLDITEAVVEQSTREEIEEVVCEGLAASDSYEFAWMAGVDPATESIDPRVEFGVDGYLDENPISIDPDDPTGRGPTGRAVQTREVQVVRDAFEDPTFEPWRDLAREYGYRASVAVPITHEGTIYGVLGVYADRTDAFTGEERRVLRQLGEVTGHAIAAVDRKRALISDELVEVEFRVRDVFEEFDLGVETGGRIALEQAVPLADGEHLVYGTATDGAGELVERFVEAHPYWDEVSFDGDEATGPFELRLVDPPILETVTSLGGSIDEAVVEDGDYRMTAHLSPGVDVRQVIDSVQEVYPGAELVTRRQVPRPDDARVRNVLAEELTDRQRTALKSAYHAGFFEWPRDNTGEDIAGRLGITSPTFQQHVRAAERKVFASLLSNQSPTE